MAIGSGIRRRSEPFHSPSAGFVACRLSLQYGSLKVRHPRGEKQLSMRKKGGFHVKNVSALFCILAAVVAVSPSDAAPPAKSSSCSAIFAGRIAYTTGVIHICDGATGVDVNTGVSGVNPKFSPDSSWIVYQGGGVSVISSV